MPSKKSDVEFIIPPNRLLEKVAKCEGVERSFAAAEETVSQLSKEFAERLPLELSQIEKAFLRFREDPEDEKLWEHLFKLVHDLKGQAGTFDYDLITVIGNDLCRFLEHSAEMTPPRLTVVGFFIDGMKRVVANEIIGDGGDFGRNIVDSLHQMTQRVLQGD